MLYRFILRLFFLLFFSSSCFSFDLSNLVTPVVPLGHTASIYATTFSKDGQLAFSLAEDQSLRVWEVASGREVKKYKVISDHVKALTVSPNGYWVVTGDNNKGLKLWDVATGEKIQRFKGHDRQVNSLDFSPDGKLLLSAGNDRKIKLWDIKTSHLIYELRAHKKKINHAVFSPDGKFFASASDDRQIIIWNTKSAKKIKKLIGHKKAILALAFSPDGQYLISAGQDKQIQQWDIKTGKKILTYKGHKKSINSIAFSPDQKSILSASDDHTIRLWDTKTGKLKLVFKGHHNKVLDIAFSAKGELILSGSKDQTLRLWGTKKANQIRIFKGLASPLNAVAVSPKGDYLFSAHNDRSLKLWDLKTGQAVRVFNRHKQAINDVTFSSNGVYVASASSDNQIVLWRVDNGIKLLRFIGHKASVNQVLFTPSNKFILSASADQTIRLWNIKKNKLEKIFKGHKRSVIAIALHPKGKSFVSSSKDKNIRLWDLKTGKSRVIATTDYPVKNLKYSHNGKFIFSAGWKLLKLDSKTGKKLLVFGNKKNAHQSDITSLALSTDGKLLASGSYDNKIKLWDSSNGKFKGEFTTPQGGILSLTFSANKKYLISAGGDSIIRLWDINHKQEILRLVASNNGEWISMTPDGYYDHSPEGNKLIHWVAKNDTYSYSFEQFENYFRRPDIIQARLSGQFEIGLPPPEMGRPPRIDFPEHLQTKHVKKDYINISLKVIDDKKIEMLRIYVNGKAVLEQSIDQKEKQLQLKIPLSSGANQITALSYNSSGLSSDPRYLSVLSEQAGKEKPNLYILSIGVSKYKYLSENSQLIYAHSDAQNFAQRFNVSAKSLYKQIYTHSMLNEEASHSKILEKLSQLSKEVGENDVLMVFYAGHGFKDTNEQQKEIFYLATNDLVPEKISSTSLDWKQLSKYLHKIKGRVMVFLDACHSGSISNQTIVPNNYLAEQFFNKKQGGIMVFSAAKGRQYAGESSSFGSGEGLFSYAISKILKTQGISEDLNGNGYIEFSELVKYVQNFVDAKSDGSQTPWLSHKELFGDIPIATVFTKKSLNK
ncbi:MAG: caspase family protein [Pseudomonadota bacterium]